MTTATSHSNVRFRRQQAPDKRTSATFGVTQAVWETFDYSVIRQVPEGGEVIWGSNSRPEWSKACFFPIPTSPRILEIISFFPDGDLKQKLVKRQRFVLVLVGFDERFERPELGTFNIDLQDVDDLVACGRI